MPTVLVVDDEEVVRRALTRCLKSQGFAVAEAMSGEEGLEQYRSLHPELIISDLYLNDMTGAAMLEEIRTLDPCVRAMVVTGSVEVPIGLGCPVLHKPFGCRELISMVRSALGEAA